MNLLSIGAAYGVMVAVFQWGWFGSALGVTAAPIEPWVPMMLFAIVFGLSMDYEVFLLSAVRETYDRTGDNGHAVARRARLDGAGHHRRRGDHGVRLRQLRPVGPARPQAHRPRPGRRGAVDATIVRMVLVPATMELLGDANWWMPRWLDRLLPKIHVDGTEPAGTVAGAGGIRAAA